MQSFLVLLPNLSLDACHPHFHVSFMHVTLDACHPHFHVHPRCMSPSFPCELHACAPSMHVTLISMCTLDAFHPHFHVSFMHVTLDDNIHIFL
jgi:hypothetical protein